MLLGERGVGRGARRGWGSQAGARAHRLRTMLPGQGAREEGTAVSERIAPAQARGPREGGASARGSDDQPGWGLASRSHWSIRAWRALGGAVCA
jgi:hypothetical protein